MNDNVEFIRELLLTTPEALLGNPVAEEYVRTLMPVDTGVEIECDKKPTYTSEPFKYIGLVTFNTDANEQRYRIPSGLAGAICIYNLCELLRKYSLFNELSGHHYRVDLTDVWDEITDDVIEENKEWILQELDTWGTILDPNSTKFSRNITRSRCWVRMDDYTKAMEIRIGEMTFDYPLFIKRVLHCHEIGNKLRSLLPSKIPDELRQARVEALREIKELSTAIEEDFNTEVSINEVEPIVRARRIRV